MKYPEGMENGSYRSQGVRDAAQIVSGGRLVDATPEAVRELAESAMLLSQGAQRAIEMMHEANDGTPPAAPITAATAEG